MRLLEEHNPDVSFDWPRLLKAVPAGPVSVPGAKPGREERRRDRREPRRTGREESQPRLDAPPSPPSTADFSSAVDAVEDSEPAALGLDAEAQLETAEIERAVVDADTVSAPPDPVADPVIAQDAEPLPERYSRLGPEGLKRLRSRYSDVRARLQANPVEDLEERDRLLARSERLNPDAWVSEGDVTQALEEYEAVFESLRPFLGRPGRPPRRL